MALSLQKIVTKGTLLAPCLAATLAANVALAAPWADSAYFAAPAHSPGPKAAVAAIDVNSRDAVTTAYNTIYNVPEPPAGFTGNVTSCTPGTVSAAYLDAILTRLNFYRAMVGLPGNVTLAQAESVNAQAAALIMSANNTLTHGPTADMRCFTQAGFTGAATSNLYLGVAGVAAVDGFLSDPGQGNELVGHRRWLLYPPLQRMGIGDITGQTGPRANAMTVIGAALNGPRPTVDFVPFPGRGFWPARLLPDSGRWSVGAVNANFANAVVTVTVNGAVVNAPVIARDGAGFGDAAIVFTPQSNLLSRQATGDVVVNVSVNNVIVGGQSRNFAYTTTLFVPAAGPACTGTLDTDGDGVGDCVEQTRGTNPIVKDNNIFATDFNGHRRFVEQQFRDYLGREGDAAGVDFWTDQLIFGDSNRNAFVETLLRSAEYDGLVAPMTRLYLGTYLRVPDFGGLQFWSGEYRKQPDRANLNRIAQAFATAPEFLARYGSIDNATYIARLYQNILGRAADTAGLNFWIGELNRGVSRGDMLANFTESAEFIARTQADTTVINVSAAMLKRAPTQVEYDTVGGQLRNGTTVQSFIDAIVRSAEYRARFLQ